MADVINVLTENDNENGTVNAVWTPRDQIDDGKKVLMGKIGELSGNMEAFWGMMDSIEPVLIEKTVTQNGSYNAADDEADGFSEVTVAVPGIGFSASPTTFKLITNIRNLNVQIPSGVTIIGNNAFTSCTGLTSIEIPSSVTIIDSNAFYGCTGLTSIEIPSGVTTIGNNVFYGCTGLTSIVVHKAEGSIAGAPWGASYATVTWDGE